MTQEERFAARYKQEQEARFAQRFADEQRAAVVTPEMAVSQIPMERPTSQEGMSREQLINQIPTRGVKAPAFTEAPPDITQRMFKNFLSGAAAIPAVGLGAKALQLGTAGTRAAPYGQAAANLFIPKTGADLARQTALSAGTAVGAGEFGQAVASKAGEEWRMPAEMVGGLALALPANSALTAGELGIKGLLNRSAGKDFFESGVKAAETIGTANAVTRLKEAMKANPELSTDLARASEIEVLTGVKLPLTAAAKGDTTFTGLLASQTARSENAAFTSSIQQQEKSALEAVRKSQRQLAGDPRNAALTAEVEAKKLAHTNSRNETANAMRQANIERQLSSIDNNIKDLTSTSLAAQTGKEDIGNRVTNLLSAREAVVKKQFSPLYDEVLQGASAKGIEMESPVVAGLWNFVKQRQAADVFNRFPALDSAINKVLAPKKAAVSGKFAEKYPNLVQSAEGKFKPLNVTDIDSLKRGINRAIGQTKDDDQLRMLYELKKRFDESLNTLPEDFVQAYKGLDKQYAEKIGLPFSEAGVVSIDRARFVESTVPLLTNKPSAIRQVLTATDNSPEALKIVEDAFLMKISQTDGIVNPNTMSVNPAALQSFVRKNAESINQVPGLRERLEGLSSNADSLLANRERLLDMQKNAAIDKIENVWSQAYGRSGGFEGFVSSALKNPEELNQLLVAAGTDPTLQRGLKAVVLDLGLKSNKKMDFFTDNAPAINTLFGKDHAENVKALLEASERLAKNPALFKINQSLSQTSQFEQQLGTDPAKAASLIRQQVQSNFYKVSTLLSRFLQNKSVKAENTEIQEFFSNPKNVRDMSEAIDAMAQGGEKNFQKAKAVAGKLLSNAATAALIGASAPARIIEREPATQGVYVPTDPSLLEGYGQ